MIQQFRILNMNIESARIILVLNHIDWLLKTQWNNKSPGSASDITP